MRLIDADALIAKIDHDIKVCEKNNLHGTKASLEAHREVLTLAPTIDPVVYGEWIIDRYDSRGKATCSRCNKNVIGVGWNSLYDYCPHCGAKMDGGK